MFTFFENADIMKIQYKYVYCNYNKRLNIFFINVEVKCYKLINVFRTVRQHLFKELMELTNP